MVQGGRIMDYDEQIFRDFKHNEMACDECGVRMGNNSETGMMGFICPECFDDLEIQHKEKHPEEYE